MSVVIPFRPRIRGAIHVYRSEYGGWDIGHESESGSSWGHFETFRTYDQAVAGANALNSELGGACAILLPDGPRAA